MKLLTFILISLISKIASTTRCKNPRLKCIELCCAITKFYEKENEYCKDISEDDEASWQALLFYNNKTVEYVEYGECEMTNNPGATIPSCYSPYYDIKSKQLVLKRWFNIPCTRPNELSAAYAIPGVMCFVTLPLCLPIMLVYTCRKALTEKKLFFKLVSCYLVSMVMHLLAVVVSTIYMQMATEATDVFEKYAEILHHFFLNSTCLWLNVIGYQIWSGYRKANAKFNSNTDKRRFICYSIYVWGIAAIIVCLQLIFLGFSWNLYANSRSRFVIAVYSLVTFVAMSVDICLIRCRVINLTHEVRFKSKLVYIICHLFLMMGIPRMLIMISMALVDTNRILIYITFVLEPFVIFIVLVLKPKNVFKCCIECCWYKKTENISHPSAVVYTNTNITNLSSLTGQNGSRNT